MKSKSFMLMILSMGFGLVAAIGISQVMGRGGTGPASGPQMGPVLVAAEELEHNSLLNDVNVTVENWPVEIIPEEAATSIEQIVDMATRSSLSKGMPIMLSHVVHKTKLVDINIPNNMKVVAIKVSEEDNFAGLLKPGDKVDVIGHFQSKDRTGTFAKTFLKALRVWSVNSSMTAESGSRTDTSTRGAAIVGVLVTERQAEAIVYVQRTGTLKLMLRGDFASGDDDDEEEVFRSMGFASLDDQPLESPQETSVATPIASKSAISHEETAMIVWLGNASEKITFHDGKLPESSHRKPTGQTDRNFESSSSRNPARLRVKDQDESSSGDFNDQDNEDDISDRDRGLEEDQYQGE
jgi:pilus assembly protein CpaB